LLRGVRFLGTHRFEEVPLRINGIHSRHG